MEGATLKKAESTEAPPTNEGTSEKSSFALEGGSAVASGKNETTVTLNTSPTPLQKVVATKPYPGMGKEDLLRFSQTPFWNRLRLGCLILFWAAWLALLAAVVVLTIVLPRCAAPPSRDWWQHTVVYDVHVPSFYDSDGDGTGDINGLHEKLDYIEDLGVDTIALSPIYDSDPDPSTGDLGYDVTNHSAVDDRLGSLADLKSLVSEVHKRDMKVVLDFIPNHTSKKHYWFEESRKGKSMTNPFWNYYAWADCDKKTPPNNWLSVYGNSSWTWDPLRGQCYFHNFLSTEPELNLRSSSVLNELDAIIRFWLTEAEVDGFRVRGASFLFEDGDLKMEPPINGCPDASSYDCLDHIYTRKQEENVLQVTRWRKLLDQHSSDTYRILAVESADPVNASVAFYGGSLLNGAHLPINAQLSKLDAQKCDGRCTREKVDDWLNTMPWGATANWQSANSEIGRLESEGINPAFQSAVTLLKLTLPGVTFNYYGEELGMTNGNLSLSSVDPVGNIDNALSRDRFRTPMQWTDGLNAGFSNSSKPRLSVNEDYSTVNVKMQNSSDSSLFSTFRKLTNLRKDQEALKVGGISYVETDDNVISYTREFNGRDSLLIAINFGGVDSTNNFNAGSGSVPGSAEVVMVTSGSQLLPGDRVSLTELKLSPKQGIVVKWPYVR